MIQDPSRVSHPGESSEPMAPAARRHTSGGKTYTVTKGDNKEEKTFEETKTLLERVHSNNPQAVDKALQKLHRGRPVKVGELTIAIKASKAWEKSTPQAARKPQAASRDQKATTAREVSDKLIAALETLAPARSREANLKQISGLVKEGLSLQDSLFYDAHNRSEREKFRSTLRQVFINVAAKGDKPLVEALIAGGAAINKWDEKREMIDEKVLDAALENGHTEVASLLLDHGASMRMGSHKDTQALFTAAEKAEATGDYRLVKLIVQKGLKCDTQQINNLLFAASYRNFPGLIRVLAEEFQTKTRSLRSYEIKPEMSFNNLFIAADQGHHAVVEAFIDACKDKEVINRLLDRAIEEGRTEIVAQLVAKASPKSTSDLLSLLSKAVKAGKPEVLDMLIDRFVTFGNLPELLVRTKNYVTDKDAVKQIEDKLVEKFINKGNKDSTLTAIKSYIERNYPESRDRKQETSYVEKLLKRVS